ncbi:MAG: PRC-barrel domain-containing protein [Fibrobacteria bacterium]
MLRPIKHIIGFSIQARDGKIGILEDIYLDDRDWDTRYAVVKIGSWLFANRVLIDTKHLEFPDFLNHCIPVSLSKSQVKDSAKADTKRPVCRQAKHGFPRESTSAAYWASAIATGDGLFMTFPPIAGDTLPAKETGPSHNPEDPHLRSAKELQRYSAVAADGAIGFIRELLLEDSDWSTPFFVIESRYVLPDNGVAVPAAWTDFISYESAQIAFSHPKRDFRAAPGIKSGKGLERFAAQNQYRNYSMGSGDGDWRPFES